MITVLDDPDAVEQAFAVGASDYITKPIQWSVLRHRLRRLLQQSQIYQHLEAANLELERLNSIVARYEGTNLH
jgi:PleD family two-component response regulator